MKKSLEKFLPEFFGGIPGKCLEDSLKKSLGRLLVEP